MTVDSIGRFAWRWKLSFVVVAVVCFLLFLSLRTIFPWPDHSCVNEYPDGRSYRVEVTRRYRFLPTAKWGYSSEFVTFCGGKTNGDYEIKRLGFFEMTDMKTLTFLARKN